MRTVKQRYKFDHWDNEVDFAPEYLHDHLTTKIAQKISCKKELTNRIK
jgi:hypothetical protein